MTSISVGSGGKAADLINQTTDWGVSVSEAVVQKTLKMRGLALAGYSTFLLASLLVIPILAGIVVFSATNGVLGEVGIIVAVIALAVFLNKLSRKGPKNALQIDYAAGEVRLGSINSAGAFVRQRVCPFRSIDSVTVDESEPDAPALNLVMSGETATIRFRETKAQQLSEFAAQVNAAAEAAKTAPVRSRIQSRINGFEANIREVGNRVRSRVRSSFA